MGRCGRGLDERHEFGQRAWKETKGSTINWDPRCSHACTSKSVLATAQKHKCENNDQFQLAADHVFWPSRFFSVEQGGVLFFEFALRKTRPVRLQHETYVQSRLIADSSRKKRISEVEVNLSNNHESRNTLEHGVRHHPTLRTSVLEGASSC